ncbi:MAG: N-acetylmuramoyl-L-alanine amidase [Anaerolineae bacterium]|nr:N-acetylmuramoyl-L-alanine amidase [Anaerolineae bacterium]
MAFRNIQVNVDDAIFQAALNRATSEGKSIGQVIADFLQQYAAGASAGAPTTYTVKSGDTLGKIAVKVYGDAHKYPLIQRANNIANPSRIWVGQVLIIPPVAGAMPAATPVPTSAPVPASTPPSSPPVSIPAPAPISAAPTITPAPTPSFSVPSVPTLITPAPPAAGQAPPKPSIEWVGSPNFNRRKSPTDITAITIHATANSTLKGVIDWFNNPNAKVSAHYTIDKDGKTVQHVRDTDRAWHAGQSVWKGRSSCNDYCIGIELVNLNDGVDPYPEAQHKANVELCAYLCHKYNISVDDIMGHLDIALPVGRKSDPRNYDLDRLRREVAAILGK